MTGPLILVRRVAARFAPAMLAGLMAAPVPSVALERTAYLLSPDGARGRPLAASPFVLVTDPDVGPALTIRGVVPGASTAMSHERPAPTGGVVSLEGGPALDAQAFQVRARLRFANEEGLVGLILVAPDQGSYLAGVVLADGGPAVALSRSGGSWLRTEYGPAFVPQPGTWFYVEVEAARQANRRRWRVYAWEDGGKRPEEAVVTAWEAEDAELVGLHPGVWATGGGVRSVAGLEVRALDVTNGVEVEDEWPIQVIGDEVRFPPRSREEEGRTLALGDLDVRPTTRHPSAARKTLCEFEFPCNPYRYHFTGTAQSYPGSTAELHLPPVDHDCDGAFNEDPTNGRDDDGDGRVDEDPGCLADALLNWSSSDVRLGDYGTGDTPAAILVLRCYWPSYSQRYVFATLDSGAWWLTGGVRTDPAPAVGVAEVGHWFRSVGYELATGGPAPEPLSIRILESGAPLADAAWFDRPVSLTADTSGGTGEVTVAATIDGQPYQPGATYSAEGEHTVRMEAVDAAGQDAQSERSFGIDLTAPAFSGLSPAAGSVLGVTPVTLAGQVSTDAESVTANGIPAALEAPAGEWRAFTAAGIALAEGPNAIALAATDRVGHATTVSHTLVLDTLPPSLTITSPADGSFSDHAELQVSGTASDANLAQVTVNGVSATLAGETFSATVTLTEGSSTITVVATDAAGHSASAALTVTLDTAAPVLTVYESGTVFTEPLLLGRPVVFSAEAADASPVELAATIDGAPYELQTPYGAEGQHALRVTATDAAGNVASADRSFTIDLGGPQVEVSSPAPGALLDATVVTVEGRASEDTSSLAVAGVTATLGAPAGGWRSFLAAGVSLEMEGENLLAVVATDAAGNATEMDLVVERDTQPPTVALTSPAESLITRLPDLTVAGAASDRHLAAVTVNDAPVAVGADGTFALPLTLVEGSNQITIVASDTLGHTATVTRTPILDTTPPVITISHGGAPLPEDLLVNAAVTPLIEVSDATAVNTSATLNGAPFASGTAIAGEGSYLLAVTATDAAGNQATLERTFRIDLTPPVLSGIKPAAGSVIANASPPLSGASDDAVTVTVNGAAATVTAGTFTFPGLALGEGANTLTIVAEDPAGNRRTLSHALTLDTVAPQVTVTVPAEGALLGESRVQVSGSVTDANLDRVTVNGLAAALAGASFQASVTLAADGAAAVTVRAVDRAGNAGEATVNVERDTTAPVLTLSEPGAGAVLAARTVTVSGVASDPHLDGVSVDSQSVTPDPAGAFTTTVSLPEGAHTLTVEAWDAAGKRASLTRQLTIDLSAPDVHLIAPRPGALLAAAEVTVTGRVTDPAGLDRVTVNGRDATVQPDGGFTLEALPLAEGANTIVARAFDGAGNSGTASIQVTADTVPPAVAAIVPADGTTGVPASAQLKVRFSEKVDPATLATGITLAAAGQPLAVTVQPETDGSSVLVVPAGGLRPDTQHRLEVTAAVSDMAGHPLAAGTSATFTTSDTSPPPAPILTAPSSPACFATLELSGTAEPGARVEAEGSVRAAAAVAAPDGGFTLLLTPTVSSGAVTVQVRAIDAAGNASPAMPVTVELDCAAPYVVLADWDGGTRIAVRHSEPLDPATVVSGSSVLLDGVSGPLPFTVEVSGRDLAVELAAPPETDELPLRLRLTADLTDPASNPAVPYEQLFADPSGATLVAGEVFDDATSLELPGARIVLEEDGSPVAGEPPSVTSDGRGRFQLPVSSSPVTVRIEADGHLPVWRRVAPVPGLSTVLFDARLSVAAASQHLSGATRLTAGAAELTVEAAAVPPAGLDVALTPRSEQGLPGLLPLGWRPLATVHVGLPDGVALDPPATLIFSGATADAVIASWDETAHLWRAEASGGTVPVAGAGTLALLAADTAPTSPGAAVPGAPLPSAEPADPGALTATLDLDPPVILPIERALGTVTVTAAQPSPSGLAVEALLDEVLHIVDGRVLVVPPAATDLVLYREPDGAMAARFGIGASDAARRLALDEGSKTIHVRTLPAGLRTQDLVGPGGGSLLTPEGLGLEVPPGALDRMVGVHLAAHAVDALPLPAPAGLEVVTAATLDMGEVPLLAPATLGFPGAGLADEPCLVLTPVEVDGETAWRLVGPAALSEGRVLCGPEVLPDLPASWVRSSGVYVLMRSTGEAWGLLSGTVLDVDGEPGSAVCRVDATGGLVQLTAADGSWAQAAPAGAVALRAERLDTRDTGATSAVATAGEHLGGIDIALEVVAPRVVATSPADGAASASATTPVAVDLSEPLDPDFVQPSSLIVEVVVGTTPAQSWPGQLALSADGTRLTWTPDERFPPACQVLVTVGGELRDRQGYPLDGGDHRFGFGVERFLLPTDVDPTKIRLYVPGRDPAHPGHAVVEGEAGAVPGDVWLWVEDLDHDAPVTTVAAGQDGAFTLLLDPFDGAYGVAPGDRLLLHVLDSASLDDDLGVVPLRPWLTLDGLGAWFGIDGGDFTTVEGVGVSVPYGALPDGGSVKVHLLDSAQAFPPELEPPYADARAAVSLEISPAAARGIELAIPGPPPAAAGSLLHACRLLDVAGRPLPMLVRSARWDPDREAYVTTPESEETAKATGRERLALAAGAGDPDPLLPGVRSSMTLVVLEPLAAAAQARAREGEGAPKGLFTVHSETATGDGKVEIRGMFASLDGSSAYAVTLWAPQDAVLVAFEPREPTAKAAAGAKDGLSDFVEAYGAAVLGIEEILNTDDGGVVPIHPDHDFVLKVIDPDTGYTFSETAYPAPSGGWVTIDPTQAPGIGGTRLELVGAVPFRVISFAAAVGEVPLDVGIRVKMAAADAQLTCTVEEGALAGRPRLRLVNLRNGATRSVESGSGTMTLTNGSGGVKVGDPLVLVVEPLLAAGDQELRLLFNKNIGASFDQAWVKLVPEGDAHTSKVHAHAAGETLVLTPDPVWESGARYQLELAAAMFAALGHAQTLPGPVRLPIKVADVVSDGPVLPPDASVGDVALEGDVLLVAAYDAGLESWDVSDPSSPRRIATSLPGLAPVARVASDGFGHVLTVEGRVGEFVSLRLRRLEDLLVDGAQVPQLDEQELSQPFTGVGPGDLDLEVFSETVRFSPAELLDAPVQGITVHPDNEETPTAWLSITVPPALMVPNHPVLLVDGSSRRVLARRTAPSDGSELVIDNADGLPLAQPLELRSHADTLVWAHAAAGPLVAAKVQIAAPGSPSLSLGAVEQNAALLAWILPKKEPEVCRELHSEDRVYLGRLAVAPRSGGATVLEAASAYEGLWVFRQEGAAPDVSPDQIDCRRADGSGDLADVASSWWHFDGEEHDTRITALVGHHRLEVLEISAGGTLSQLAVKTIEWSPFRVALDTLHRQIVVRDNDTHLRVYSLTKRAADGLVMVADITLPEGSGMGPLTLDPETGLAFPGNAPVQYRPPEIELVADPDGDGVLERIDYLQPLGAPEAPAVDGKRPPYLAWVRARLPGASSDTVRVRIDGLGPGGAALPLRPSPFLPTSTVLELYRTPGLRLDDDGRHTFLSDRPILLIADERARTEYWSSLDAPMKAKLTAADEARAVYALCRNCDRDTDDDGTADLEWGVPAPRPGEVLVSGDDTPLELAASARLRITLDDSDLGSGWLKRLVDTNQAPTGEATSVSWMRSPPVTAGQGIEVRTAAAPEVELSSGALTLARSDLELPAPGLDVSLGRTYTSGGIVFGAFGWGWGMAGVGRLREAPDGTVELHTGSGERYVFGNQPGVHPGSDGATLTAYGYPGELKKLRSGGWLLKRPDDGYTTFDGGGYPELVRDRLRTDERSGSELRYHWFANGTLAQLSQANASHSEDTVPRTISFTYGEQGLVEAAQDSTGRTYRYGYDDNGRLTSASIGGVRTSSSGGTATVTESYQPELASVTAAIPGQLDHGAQLAEVTDAGGNVVVHVTWDGRQAQGLRRGAGADALVTTVSRIDDSHWQIQEGSSSPIRTHVALTDEGTGWRQRVVVGEGSEASESSTLLDRDGRVLETVDSGGITTTTEYLSGERRYSFSPTLVTTTAGAVGEPASVSSLATRYEYLPGSSLVREIRRPGPTGVLSTVIGRDSLGNPISVTGPDGTVTRRTFDALGRVVTQTSSTGAVSTMSYDDAVQGSGEPSRTVATTAAGTSTSDVVRNAQSAVISTRMTSSDPSLPSRTTTSDVNVLGWTLETSSGPSVTRTTYDASGRIARIQSSGPGEGAPSLSTTVPTYTSAGMISGITRSAGELSETTSMTYFGSGSLATSTTADLTTSYAYDSAGRTLTRQEGALPATTYAYDAAGRLSTTTTPGGKTWTNVYDTLGRHVGRIDPAGVRETLVLAPDGQLRERRLIFGGELWSWEEMGYDAAGRQTSHTVHRFEAPQDPESPETAPLTTETTYYGPGDGAKNGLVRSISSAPDKLTTFDYDDAGREVLRSLPDGTEVATAYYPDGKVHTRTVSYDGDEGAWSLTTQTTYDDQGRVATVTEPGDLTTSTLYDELGRRRSETAPDSEPGPSGEEHVDRVTLWGYGDMGRTVTTTRPDGAVITRVYDERGNLTTYEDTDQNRTTYAYDEHGRLERITYPDDSHRDFTYLPDGELETITRADGSLVSFTYDQAGRLESAEVTGGVQPGGTVSYGYDPLGRLLSASDADASLGFTWDSVGNQLSESLALPGPAPGLGTKTLTRTFDLANRPERLGMPDGLPDLVRAYDRGDRLVGLSRGGEALWRATYAGARWVGSERGNGLATTLAYDTAGRPTEVLTGVPDIGGVISDPIHHLGLSWTEASLRRAKSRSDLDRIVERFHYDGAGHLESNSRDGIPAVAAIPQDLAEMVPDPTLNSLQEWWTVNTVDELAERRRVLEGRQEVMDPTHNALHQVVDTSTHHYDWDVNGNLRQSHLKVGTDLIPEATYTHDWRDRLVEVEQGEVDTRLVVDPLGRLVAKVVHTPAGDAAHVYLHDGDQVVAEYVQEAGGPSWQLDRRKHWGRWIDDLVAEEVDTDHDGAFDTTLYPVTDLLGSVQLLTNQAGRIVERITYDTDGTPHFFGPDDTWPTVTRVAWTGAGARPTGDTVDAQVFEMGLSEWIDEASVADAVATLTPEGGEPIILDLALTPHLRGATLSGAAIESGITYTLHIEGLEDRAGNAMWPLDVSFTITDLAAYQVLQDDVAPQILAVLDSADGLYVLLDEPVVPASGVALEDAITVERGGAPVAGSTSRISSQLLKWTPTRAADWLIGGEYQVTAARLTDLSSTATAVSTTPLPISFTHLASELPEALLTYSEPSATRSLAESRYGLTSLFQGRTWHTDLGLHYLRARWSISSAGSFLSRDPLGYVSSQSPFAVFRWNSPNHGDPSGLYEKDFHFYAGYYLARSAGFPHDDACQLAWASQYVDDNPFTSPANFGRLAFNRQPLYGFHFLAASGEVVTPGNLIAVLNTRRSLGTSSLISLGIALHSLADTYSHEGYTAAYDLRNRRIGGPFLIGHADAGHYPDLPFLNPRKAMDAAQALYGTLTTFASNRGYAPFRSWPMIGWRLRQGFAFIGDLASRVQMWKKIIAEDFLVYLDYDILIVDPYWRYVFDARAEEQSRFVLDLEEGKLGDGIEEHSDQMVVVSPQ